MILGDIQLIGLEDAGVAVLDCEHRTPALRPDGYIYVAIPDLVEGRIDISRARRISSEDYESWTRRTTPESGDVVVTRRGRVGDSAVVPEGLKCAIGQNLVILRSDGTRLDQRYLRWAVRSPQWWSEVERLLNVGAVFSSLNVRDIARMRVPVPELAEQRAIADVLGALDDKISANDHERSLLHRLALAEFDRLMRHAKTYVRLGAVVNLEYGKSLPATQRRAGAVDVFGSGGVVGSHDKSLVEGPGVVLGRKGTAGAVHWAPRAFFPIDTTFYVVPRDPNVSLIYAYFALKWLRLGERNSDSAVPGLNREEALAATIPLPAAADLVRFTTLASASFDLASRVELESKTLAATRDALLPALMSGRLRVRDVDSPCESADR